MRDDDVTLQIRKYTGVAEADGEDTGAECGSGVERCHRLDNRSFRRRNEERLAQGLETPVGPVDAYDDARECAHVSSRRRDVGHDDVRAIALMVICRALSLRKITTGHLACSAHG